MFLEVVQKASKDNSIGSIFEGLNSTLRFLEPIIKGKDSQDLPKEKIGELTELMIKGWALVCKCTRSHLIRWNKHRYAKKLRKLQDSILRIFQAYIPLALCRDSKELLLEVKDLDLEIRRMNNFAQERVGGNGKRTESLESCKVPKEPNFIVGLDDSFHKLKEQLLEGGVSVLVISAPEGFGKTTLVKKLGHDLDVEGIKFLVLCFLVSHVEY